MNESQTLNLHVSTNPMASVFEQLVQKMVEEDSTELEIEMDINGGMFKFIVHWTHLEGAPTNKRYADAAQPPADFWKSFLDAVWWEFEEGERRTVPCNAPGHDHETIGIWDADNGELAGKPCDWCKTWNAAVVLVDKGDSR